MNAIILFSHGSLLCGAGESLREHAERLRGQGLAPVVEIGYLNYSAPPFAEAVTRCVQAGASRIVVSPYFLVPGKFVRMDLPAAIAAAQTAYPGVEFVTADAIGYDERLAEALIESAFAALPAETWGANLTQAAAHCRPDPQCPLYNTPQCPKHPGSDAPRLGD